MKKLEKLGLDKFKKNELENPNKIFGGLAAAPTTKHKACYLDDGNGDHHYVCDHSADVSA